jgi:type I restriction enzyme M protein
VYADVPGLCKAITRQDIAENEGSLTPGRYVGVAVGAQDDDADIAFLSRMRVIHTELDELSTEATRLASEIQSSMVEILG